MTNDDLFNQIKTELKYLSIHFQMLSQLSIIFTVLILFCTESIKLKLHYQVGFTYLFFFWCRVRTRIWMTILMIILYHFLLEAILKSSSRLIPNEALILQNHNNFFQSIGPLPSILPCMIVCNILYLSQNLIRNTTNGE